MDLTRAIVDQELAEYFPKGNWSRKEDKSGWTDSLPIGFLELQVTVSEKSHRTGMGARLEGSVRAEVWGVRTGDGSVALLWRKDHELLQGLRVVLKEAHMILVGLASGILMVTAQDLPVEPAAKGTDSRIWNKLFDSNPDLGKIFK